MNIVKDSIEPELSDLKSLFFEQVTHEFRTQLSVILLASELLKCSSDQMTEVQARYLQNIQAASRKLSRLSQTTMIFENYIENLLASYLNKLGLAWWVKVDTAYPVCTYYFGPFINAEEAVVAQHGYIEDLAEESAQRISAQISRCQPKELTIVIE